MTRPGFTMRSARVAVCTLAIFAGLAGCSQTKALAPVGGNELAEVRIAANDVLRDANVAILVAPVCTASGTDDDVISCTGSTVANETITVLGTGDEPTLRVVVGSKVLYDGPLSDVINAHARSGT